MKRLFGGRAVVLAVACVLGQAGCAVPVPPLGYSSTSRDNLPDQVPGFIVNGKTTREDVLLALGTPDLHSPDGRSFIYHSERHAGGIVFIVAAGSSAGGAGTFGYEERRLTVRFDERAVVVDATLENRICPRGVAFMGATGGASPACLRIPDPSGGPSPGVSMLRTVHVVKAEADAQDIDQLFVAALRHKGLEATSGAASRAPPDVDALLTYRLSVGGTDQRIDQVTALLQAPGSSEALALASSERLPHLRKTPEDMVAEVLTVVFTGLGRPFLTLPPYEPAPGRDPSAAHDKTTVHVEPVLDGRAAPRGSLIGERLALGVSMGRIDMSPLPVEIIGQLLREELALLGHRDVADGAQFAIDAQLTKFEVRTPSTIVYWDVTGEIAVELGVTRREGTRQALHYQTTCLERTYVALSEPMIRGVVLKCLDGLGAKVRGDPALARLLAAN